MRESEQKRPDRAVLVSSEPSFVERLWRATLNSWKGFSAAARTETALRQELAALALAVPLAFVITAEPWKRLLLIASVLFVVIIELLNTALEKLSDHVTPEKHPTIGTVKDMGSAAVGGALLLAGLVWIAALGEAAGLW